MGDISHKVLLLSLLLLFLNSCASERTEREKSVDLRGGDDGGDVNHKENTDTENQQTSVNRENGNGVDSNEEPKQTDGLSFRFEPENINY